MGAIVTALQTAGVRLEAQTRSMVWDEWRNSWVVLGRDTDKPRHYVVTADEGEAVEVLLEGEQ